MKKSTVVWSALLILLAVSFLSAQTVNVTFRVNTATVPDTIGPNAVVQVRGGTAPLTWGNDTGGQMVNIGGDYWEVTLAFPTNSSTAYKFFANATGDGTGNGWEEGSDLQLTIGTADTVLPLHYFRIVGSANPFDPPYVPTDSFDVYFRVNVQAFSAFDPATQTMMVKGGTWPGAWGDLTWNGDSTLGALTMETTTSGQFGYDVTKFYSGRLRIPNDSITVGQSIPYKFVSVNKNTLTPVIEWESISDRTFNVPANKADTTIHWKWWNDIPYLGATGEDSVMVQFRADLTRAISENGFTPGDDTLFVQWGDNGTAIIERATLIKEGPFGNIYSVEDTAKNVELGKELQYNYYIISNGVEYRELFYDFSDPNPIPASKAEKRKLLIASPLPTQPVVVNDTVSSDVDNHRQPRFQNVSVLSKNVTVYWEVDLRPPYYQILIDGDTLIDIQGSLNVGPAQLDSIFTTWGVYINGLATDGWTTWGSELRNAPGKKMWDDGATGGDVTADDSVYTTTWFYSGPDSGDIVGQVFKFGIYGGDNEGGRGGFGNNHIENIVVQNPGIPDPEEITIFSQFGSINPLFYSRWNFDLGIVGIENESPVQVTQTPRLERNYPNPFNPVTTIKFSLPNAMDVKLEIYNALGQKVTTLINGKTRAGQHIVNWNGIDSKGRAVASGFYFCRLTTDNYTKTMKMLLMK